MIWTIPAAALLAVLGVPWTLRAILAHRTVRQVAQPRVEMLEPGGAALPEDVSRLFSEREGELTALGFAVRGRCRVARLTSRLEAFLLVLVATEEKIAAVVSALRASWPSGARTATALELVTRYADGSAVVTTSSDRLRPFPSPPGRTVVQLPTTAEAAALLLVHRLLLRARGEPSARVLRLSGDDASALASLSLTEEIERQAASGWTRRTADAQFYRPTWKGAALLSWNRLWPITAARRARLLRREREILAQALSSGPEPAPAGLAPS